MELVKFLDTIVAQLVKPSYVAAVQPLDGICADEGMRSTLPSRASDWAMILPLECAALHYGVRDDVTTGGHVKFKMGRNPARTASGDWNICLPISQNTPLAIIVCIHAEALRYASSKSSSVTSPKTWVMSRRSTTGSTPTLNWPNRCSTMSADWASSMS